MIDMDPYTWFNFVFLRQSLKTAWVVAQAGFKLCS